MTNRYREIAFTDAVRTVQREEGSLAYNSAGMAQGEGNDRLGEGEALFLSRRDSFYLASVSATGWPYLQHRGGPPGFVRVLAPDRIGWAEFAGNRQYITTGNLRGDDRVSLFFVDYARRLRLKLMGHARVVSAGDPALAALAPEGYRARIERGMDVRVAGFDWNCPQHIAQRFTVAEVEAASQKMLARIAALEEQLAALKG